MIFPHPSFSNVYSAFTQSLGSGSTFFWLSAGHHEQSLTLMEKILESNLFNIVLVLLVLAFLVKKFNLVKQLDAQCEQIVADVEVAERQKQEATDKLNEVKKKIANVEQEIHAILEDAQKTGVSISEQLIKNAKQESLRLVENAQKRVELEKASALRQLEANLLRDAVSDARLELKSVFSAQEQANSIEVFLEELPTMERVRR